MKKMLIGTRRAGKFRGASELKEMTSLTLSQEP